MPTEITVSVDEWKEFVDSCPEKYEVCWNMRRNYTRRHDDGEPSTKRGKPSETLWSYTFVCHREEQKRVHKDRVIGGKSGKVRPVQKESKKIGCTAKLAVVCRDNDSNSVVITVKNIHNHDIGAVNDLQYLPLSSQAKTEVMQRLSEGYRQRDIRVALP
ncbi:hypothetical protein DFQ28_000638 [Apophysomyces sp. BC1034]|nr:hypothetical protein DFQ30_007119 [Apophysomyces sp. BC1015]KAG0176494.1 hypothetical protein DFQ29_006049 [Apophysomyces sp. BC1021]KAG0183893.1 hypothetical protein DFQ28_000638 [Apophysomyces sp. BC1034]